MNNPTWTDSDWDEYVKKLPEKNRNQSYADSLKGTTTHWQHKNSKRPKRPKRLDRSFPKEFVQFCNASTYYDRNSRLTMGARTCLRIITGFCGKKSSIQTTIGGLAEHIGVSYRTVQRYIKELRDEGAITTCLRKSRHSGMNIGLVVQLGKLVKNCFSGLNTAQKLLKTSVDRKVDTVKKIYKSTTKTSPFKGSSFNKEAGKTSSYVFGCESQSLGAALTDLEAAMKNGT